MNSFQRLTTQDELNNAVQPLLTDLYQISMAYAYWKTNRNDTAVFDLFFRKNPFNGEFTIFSGIQEVLKFLRDFKFTDSGMNLTFCYYLIPLNIQYVTTYLRKLMTKDDLQY